MGRRLMIVLLRVEDRVLLLRRTASWKVAVHLMWDSSVLIAGTS